MSIRDALSRRWHVILGVLLLIFVLAPRPWPRPMLGAIESASFYAEQGSFERALQQYRQALVFAPHEESLRLEAARSAQMAGVPAQALELLSESRLNGPAAECLVFQSEFELADPGRLTGLATTGPAGCNVPLEIIQAKLDRAYKSGDLQLAESLAWHWARLEPESPQAWTRLAIIRVLLDPEQAAASLQQAVELVPGSPMMLDLLADLQVAQNSERSFQFARLGQTFSRHEMWFEAALAFNKALELEPKYVEARAFYGLALDRGGGDGLAELEAAYRAAPQAALPAAFLGLHWLEQDEPERALIYLQRALEREPDNPGHHAQYGAALAEAGDLQSARSAFEESTRLAPESPEFWMLTARFSVSNAIDIEGLGLPAARRAYLLDPNAEHADLLGYAHLLLGNLPVAARFIHRSLAADPDRAEAHYHNGLLAVEQRAPEDARRSFLRVMDLVPDSVLADLAQRSLDRLAP